MYTITMAPEELRLGRPSIPRTKRRSSVVNVRITDREFKRLSLKAKKAKLTVSTYVAELIKRDLEG